MIQSTANQRVQARLNDPTRAEKALTRMLGGTPLVGHRDVRAHINSVIRLVRRRSDQIRREGFALMTEKQSQTLQYALQHYAEGTDAQKTK